MKVCRALVALVCLALLLRLTAGTAQAQELPPDPPVVDILGEPDTRTDPPYARVTVSVVDRLTGRAIDELHEADFAVQVAGAELDATVSLETTGLAVVIVIDRGGISRRGDPRIARAVGLAETLLDLLSVDGSSTADMVGLIGIRGKDDGGLTPIVPFTDYDPNAIRNSFDVLRTEIVDETTPLYDGLDRALTWIARNPDPEVRAQLTHRRKVIFIFSDGIDRAYSNEAHETLIVNQARAHDVLIYAIQMTDRGRSGDPGSLSVMATQSRGAFSIHSPDTHEQILASFDNIVTQRYAYLVTFPLLRPQGLYQLEVTVADSLGGVAYDAVSLASHLQRPTLSLDVPSGPRIRVPYSETTEAFVPTAVSLAGQLIFRDGAPREPAEVSYFANEQRIGSSISAPGFVFQWDLTNLRTPEREAVTRTYTLVARATDPYLDEALVSEPVDVEVVWEPRVDTLRTRTEEVSASVAQTWWVLPILGVLALGLLALAAVLVRSRRDTVKPSATGTAVALKGATQRLDVGSATVAQGKLVAVHGPRAGSEFRLETPTIKVGRDVQFSDFALHDRFVSNPHLSIVEERGQFYIQDLGSTNQTRLNGTVIPPHQRFPLPPDSIIEAGQTRLQFKRLGGATRRLGTEAAGLGSDISFPPTQYAPSPSDKTGETKPDNPSPKSQ